MFREVFGEVFVNMSVKIATSIQIDNGTATGFLAAEHTDVVDVRIWPGCVGAAHA